MKTVTIPTDHTRFVVEINGRKLVFRGGETYELADDVADQVEKYIAAEPKALPHVDITPYEYGKY
jgi:hypothetical protein